jgi:hypothetical protein
MYLIPYISAAHYANALDATRCSVWRREASLLADCWQVLDRLPERVN